MQNQKYDLLISKCTILPMNNGDPIRNGAIAIKDSKIVYVGGQKTRRRMQADINMEAKGKIAIPGLINRLFIVKRS